MRIYGSIFHNFSLFILALEMCHHLDGMTNIALTEKISMLFVLPVKLLCLYK